MEAAVTAILQQRLRLISEFPKFRLPTEPNQHYSDLVPSHRGALRNVINAGRDAMDAAARETSAACWRTAKSCRSGAPMLASSLREEAQATVSNKPGHRGEREVSRKTIARGMPGDFRCDRGDYARVLCFISAREAAGASSARHSLRPLISQGQDFKANLARKPRRDREAVFVHGGLFEM